MQESLGMPTSPHEQTRLFRWMSPAGQDNLHVTALNPGDEKLGLELSKESDSGFAVKVTGASGYRRTIRLTSELKLKK